MSENENLELYEKVQQPLQALREQYGDLLNKIETMEQEIRFLRQQPARFDYFIRQLSNLLKKIDGGL